mgnify:FL=1
MDHTNHDRMIIVLIGPRGGASLGTVRLGDWFEPTNHYQVNHRRVIMWTTKRNVARKASRGIIPYGRCCLWALTRDGMTIWCIFSHVYDDDIKERNGKWPRHYLNKWPRRRPVRVIDIEPDDIRNYMYKIADADTYGLSHAGMEPDDEQITYDDGADREAD